MDYLIRTPQGHPEQERLKKIVEHLLTFIHAEAIYISIGVKTGKPFTIITTVVTDGKYNDSDELGDSKIVDLYPDIIFKFFDAGWAKRCYRKGNPYFMLHCTIRELAYCSRDTKVFYPLSVNIKHLMRKSKKRYWKDIEAVDMPLRGLPNFTNSNNLDDAAYQLYQAFRSLYICAASFLTSYFTGTDYLMAQSNWIKPFAPSLQAIMNEEVLEDEIILRQLTDALFAVRGNRAMDASEELIAMAREKIKLLRDEVEVLFSDTMEACRVKLKSFRKHSYLSHDLFNGNIPSNFLIDTALYEIGTIITAHIKTSAIFCFGYIVSNEDKHIGIKNSNLRNPEFHLYLLVLTVDHEENALAQLQGKIREHFEGGHNVTILLQRKRNLSKRGDNEKYFLSKVAQNGITVFNDPENLFALQDVPIKGNSEISKMYWINRYLAAQQYLELAQTCFRDEEALIANSLLHQCVVQLALGLIEVFIGYRPNKHSMNFLISLLEFIEGIAFPFDKQNVKDIELYKLLSANPEMVKNKSLQGYCIEDSKVIEHKCGLFLSNAEKLAMGKLDELEN
jgi:hypothetical protein